MLNKLFYEEWLDVSTMIDDEKRLRLTTSCSPDFFYSLKFDTESLRQYACEAAIECSKILGDNIALCLSGGLDSQFMIMAFREAGIKFKVYTLEFNNELNDYDYNHAKIFCEDKKIEYNSIPFNVVNFLNYKNQQIGVKYKSSSPHFNVHYEMFSLLRDKGHTGIAAGGVYPQLVNAWGENLTQSLNFVNYCLVENFIAQGSFLSFYPKLAWALGLLHEPMILYDKTNASMSAIDRERAIGYKHKIRVFDKFKFDLIPQEKKFTGFEKTKLYYENLTGDGWFFEKNFRYPLATKFIKVNVDSKVLHLTDDQEAALRDINSKHMVSC